MHKLKAMFNRRGQNNTIDEESAAFVWDFELIIFYTWMLLFKYNIANTYFR
jgi:hypothetical protein